MEFSIDAAPVGETARGGGRGLGWGTLSCAGVVSGTADTVSLPRPGVYVVPLRPVEAPGALDGSVFGELLFAPPPRGSLCDSSLFSTTGAVE